MATRHGRPFASRNLDQPSGHRRRAGGRSRPIPIVLVLRCHVGGSHYVEMVTDPAASTPAKRYNDATARLDAVREDAVEKFLQPFAETFADLHEVSLGDIPTREALPELDNVDTEALETAQVVVDDLIEGSEDRVRHAAALLALQSVSANAFLLGSITRRASRAVPGVLEVRQARWWSHGAARFRASAPTAVAVLQRAQRTFANNKKTILLGGAMALTASVLVWAVTSDLTDNAARLEEERRKKVREIEKRRADLIDADNLARLLFATDRATEAVNTLTALVELGVGRLPALQELIEKNDDYATYPTSDRLFVAEMAGLAQTTAAVIAAAVALPPKEGAAADGPADSTFTAAQQVVSRFTHSRNPGMDAAPMIATVFGSMNTLQERQQLAHVAESTPFIHKAANRCANAHPRVSEGFLFEELHALSFNLDAISKDSHLRAVTTERLRRPADAADVEVVAQDGIVLRQVQAKVIEQRSKRGGLQNGISDKKYTGMDRLLPTDHLPEVDTRFGALMNRPEGNVFKTQYDDALELSTDRISVEGVASAPMTTAELTAAAQDTHGFLRKLAADTERSRVVKAATAAGGTSVITSFMTDVTSELITERSLREFGWAGSAVAAARTGVATTVAVTAGTMIQVSAEQRVADGAAGFFAESLARSDHGVALTQGAVEIAAIAHALATGRLTQQEAAVATAEAIVQSALTWVASAAAGSVIPNAELAALVGGFAGQYGGKLLGYGIRVAILGRPQGTEWDAAYDALLADLVAVELESAAQREDLVELGRQHHVAFTECVLPALETLAASAGPESWVDPDDQLVAMATIADQFAGTPVFANVDEFEAFMADPDTVLVLDLGGR